MSGDPVLQESSSLPNLSCSELCLESFSNFSSLPRATCPSATASEAGADIDQARKNNIGWTELLGPGRPVLELLGLSFLLRRIFSLSYTCFGKFCSFGKKQRKTKPFLERFLFLVLWLLGCIALSIPSGIYSILRAMLASRLYTRLGLGNSSQKAGRTIKEDASSTTVLQDRLEVANLAVKQLKSEGLAFQEKLKAAGERITRLEASQVDHAAFSELQAKYAQVSAELARLAKENEELKANGVRLIKENAELRQCVAMKSPDAEDETDRLGMLARLQNQCLDSCIFPKDGETPVKKGPGEKTNEASEDSIFFVTGTESPEYESRCSAENSASVVPESTPHSPGLVLFVATPEKTQTKNPSPIPVFTTVRPSLPPKASKLKPLLLAARSAPSGSPRRNSIKRGRARKYSLRQHENIKVGSVVDMESEKKEVANDHNQTKTLNPCAPAFTPRVAVGDPASVNFASANEVKPINSELFKAVSPSFSPFVFASPSPNSPFLRPPPARRQSEDAPFPTLKTTPPTPSTPIPESSAPSNIVSGTPRSTRASSVRLIRVRAALRNSQRVASGSSAILPGSPAGLKTVVGLGAKGAQAKVRLIGKGMPPRRALGEVTNADSTAESRWTSL